MVKQGAVPAPHKWSAFHHTVFLGASLQGFPTRGICTDRIPYSCDTKDPYGVGAVSAALLRQQGRLCYGKEMCWVLKSCFPLHLIGLPVHFSILGITVPTVVVANGFSPTRAYVEVCRFI